MTCGGARSLGEVRPEDIVELLDETSALLRGVWREGTAARAMALVVSTLATHGRMMRYLVAVEAAGEVDPVGIARMRWALGSLAQQVREATCVTPIAIKRCHQYVEAAGRELRRVGEMLVEAAWEPSGERPGGFSRRRPRAG